MKSKNNSTVLFALIISMNASFLIGMQPEQPPKVKTLTQLAAVPAVDTALKPRLMNLINGLAYPDELYFDLATRIVITPNQQLSWLDRFELLQALAQQLNFNDPKPTRPALIHLIDTVQFLLLLCTPYDQLSPKNKQQVEQWIGASLTMSTWAKRTFEFHHLLQRRNLQDPIITVVFDLGRHVDLTLLRLAVAAGNLELVSLLLQWHIDPDDSEVLCPLVSLAIYNAASDQMINLLLKQGAEPENHSNALWDPIIAALFAQEFDIVELLVQEAAVNVNDQFLINRVAPGVHPAPGVPTYTRTDWLWEALDRANQEAREAGHALDQARNQKVAVLSELHAFIQENKEAEILALSARFDQLEQEIQHYKELEKTKRSKYNFFEKIFTAFQQMGALRASELLNPQ